MKRDRQTFEPYLQSISTHKLKGLFTACEDQSISVEYSLDPYVTEPNGHLQLDSFLRRLHQPDPASKLYVSHPFIFEGLILSPELYAAVGGPQTIDLKPEQIRMARLFAGCRGTGTHVHQHTRACFECLQGEKLWFLAPHSKQNSAALATFNHEVSGPSPQSLSEWFQVDIKQLWPQLRGASLIHTRAGESLFIPDRYFHATLNLTACIGISYSWRSSHLTFQHDALTPVLA